MKLADIPREVLSGEIIARVEPSYRLELNMSSRFLRELTETQRVPITAETFIAIIKTDDLLSLLRGVRVLQDIPLVWRTLFGEIAFNAARRNGHIMQFLFRRTDIVKSLKFHPYFVAGAALGGHRSLLKELYSVSCDDIYEVVCFAAQSGSSDVVDFLEEKIMSAPLRRVMHEEEFHAYVLKGAARGGHSELFFEWVQRMQEGCGIYLTFLHTLLPALRGGSPQILDYVRARSLPRFSHIRDIAEVEEEFVKMLANGDGASAYLFIDMGMPITDRIVQKILQIDNAALLTNIIRTLSSAPPGYSEDLSIQTLELVAPVYRALYPEMIFGGTEDDVQTEGL